MEKTCVTVKASESYPVWIGRGLLSAAGELAAEKKTPCKAALISDSTTGELFEGTVEQSLKQAGFATVTMRIPAGETSKNMGQLTEVLEFLAQNKLDRSDLVVALGGGVVGDLAGFAAAVYLRGIDYIQIPTTFLAAIDSSVGGKTAVDLPAGKNLAGAFHQPVAVICDCDAFQTLPAATFADGAAEAVKYGVLAGGELFSALAFGRDGRPGLPEDSTTQIVEQCVAIKAGVVERDEFDTGERQLLNLGHTIGHAIERCSVYKISHGQAVAAGMAIMARAAERAGRAGSGTAEKIEAALRVQALPIGSGYSAEELFQAASSDKKRVGKDIQIVEPLEIGRCEIRKIAAAQLYDIIQLGLSESKSGFGKNSCKPEGGMKS